MIFLATLPIGFLTLLSPSLGVAVLFSLLPLYLLRFNISGVPTTFLELATYAVFLVALIKYFINSSFRQVITDKAVYLVKSKKWFLVILTVFFITIILATLITLDSRRSLGVFKGWFFDPILAGFLLYFLISSAKQIRKLILGLTTVAAGLSFYGLLDYYLPNPAVYNDYLARLDSVFTSANYHALLIGPVIVMSLVLLLWQEDLVKLQKIILVGSLIFNLWAFYLTYSYGGYLGLSLALAFVLTFYYLSRPARRKVFNILAIVFSLALSLTFITVLQSGKFQRDFGNLSGTSALRGRVEIWQTSVEIIKRHPVIGLGLGNFEKGYVKYVHDATTGQPLEAVVIHAHNIFLNFWNEAGFLGLTSFIVILMYVFYLFRSSLPFGTGLSVAAGGGLVYQLGHGLIDTPYFKNDLSYLFWLTIFILLFLHYFYQKQSIDKKG